MKLPLLLAALVAITLILLADDVTANPAVVAQANFEDKKEGSGISFVTRNFASGEHHLIETMGGGVAVFDYNNDGLPDIYFVNGAPQPSLLKSAPGDFNRLYRNDGNWKFTDVTEEAGVQGKGFDMGVAAADFDNDGLVDLLVTSVNRLTLYHNEGNGHFRDVTSRLGAAAAGWTVGAAWFDADNDGNLDLFIVRYVDWNPANEPWCGETSPKIRTYCHPRFYGALSNVLLRNNGDGTFTDISRESGIHAHAGKGMAAAIGDADGDGRMDIFVTNDTLPNFLFHNEGGGRFREIALRAGVAFNDDGQDVSSMGADFRDLDNDGREDIAVTALMSETFPLFRNLAGGRFTDVTYATGYARATNALSGWGIGAFDFNNDGWKDLFIANGDVQDNTELFSSRHSKQPDSLLINNRHGGFTRLLAGRPARHRGAAFGDFDGDGRVDAVVTALNGPPELLRNTATAANHWLEVQLVGSRSNRDGIGAKVMLKTAHSSQMNRCTTAVGYASSSMPSVHFGLGGDTTAELEIEWPSGARQTVSHPAIDRRLRIEEPR